MANFFRTVFTKSRKLDTDGLIVKKTVISFFFFAVFGMAAFFGWQWLRKEPRQEGANYGKTSSFVRKILNTNEDIFKGLLSNNHIAKEYPISSAVNPARVNGHLGLKTPLDSSNWAMNVIKA